jgi:hypothetical protein
LVDIVLVSVAELNDSVVPIHNHARDIKAQDTASTAGKEYDADEESRKMIAFLKEDRCCGDDGCQYGVDSASKKDRCNKAFLSKTTERLY